MSKLFSWSGHPLFCLLARWYLGYVFVLASWHKIAHPASFALDIATYGILPLCLVNPMAICLPWVEIVAGLMLIAGFRSRAAGLMVVGMMTVFIIALLMALAQGLDMSCGCFASQGAQGEDPISYRTVLRDLAWFGLGLYVVLFDRVGLGLDGLLQKRRDRNG